jgi:hypothetical protein
VVAVSPKRKGGPLAHLSGRPTVLPASYVGPDNSHFHPKIKRVTQGTPPRPRIPEIQKIFQT